MENQIKFWGYLVFALGGVAFSASLGAVFCALDWALTHYPGTAWALIALAILAAGIRSWWMDPEAPGRRK